MQTQNFKLGNKLGNSKLRNKKEKQSEQNDNYGDGIFVLKQNNIYNEEEKFNRNSQDNQKKLTVPLLDLQKIQQKKDQDQDSISQERPVIEEQKIDNDIIIDPNHYYKNILQANMIGTTQLKNSYSEIQDQIYND